MLPFLLYFYNVLINFFSKSIRYYSSNPDYSLSKAHDSDACYDIQSSESCIIGINERALISTGLYFQLPRNWEGQIRSRSGLAMKHGIRVLNSPGTVDASYRGEVKVILHNTGNFTFRINPGDRIAQVKFDKVPKTKPKKVNHINFSTDRGQKGFGSSGK